ncbi:hypothetical protein PVAG01_04771 [Phlyctema vagabunda]|uniref:Uncharacterized protein n=1 Tax=Phlyctema vagabunda TaxID=108571 RepID=A0ABR4PI86_9HELO
MGFLKRAVTAAHNQTASHYTIVVTHTTPWARNQNSTACVKGALFFRGNSAAMLILLPMALAGLSIFLTAMVRKVTPESSRSTKSKKEESQPTTERSEATSSPGLSPAETETDQPPPYDPEAVTTEPEPTVPKTPRTKTSSAQNFVVGSALFFSNIFVLVLGGLSVQAVIHCAPWSPLHPIFAFMWWAVYTVVTWFASFGAMCWLMLLRDLWGPRMIKRYPIEENAMLILVIGVVISPFFLLGTVSIKGIEWLQRRFCADDIEEDGDMENGVELREAHGLSGGDHSERDGPAIAEERLGLIGGMEK